jgi:transcriptional regulator with XRE-family HTH domain
MIGVSSKMHRCDGDNHRSNSLCLAKQLGFSCSYLSSLANGQFNPSREGCVKIADLFGDSPNIIFELAVFFFPEKDVQQDLEIAYILKDRADRKHAAQRRLKATEENGQTKT